MKSREVEDDDDEFEPLFDYARVYKPPADDDSDGDVTGIDGKFWQDSTKRPRSSIVPLLDSNSPLAKGIDDETEEDFDWLPPPPKSAKISLEARISEDPTFLQLRQEREELMSLTASSEAALKKLEENSRGHNVTSEQPELTPDSTQKVPASGIREKVLVSIQSSDGVCKAFRVFMDDKFEKLFMMYAESICKSLDLLGFCFDGQQIAGDNTPRDMGIENEDIIEVFVRT